MSGSPKRIQLRAFDTPLTDEYVEVKRASVVGKDEAIFYLSYLNLGGTGPLEFYLAFGAGQDFDYISTLRDIDPATRVVHLLDELMDRAVKFPTPIIPANVNGNTTADSATFTDTVTDLSGVKVGDVLEIQLSGTPADQKFWVVTNVIDQDTLEIANPVGVNNGTVAGLPTGTQAEVTYEIRRPDRFSVETPVGEFHARLFVKEDPAGNPQGLLGVDHISNFIGGS